MRSLLLESITHAEIEAEEIKNNAKATAQSSLIKERAKIDKDKKKFLIMEQENLSKKLDKAREEMDKEYIDFISNDLSIVPVDTQLKRRAVDMIVKGVLDI